MKVEEPEETPAEGAPEWMVTFSDMTNLLLTFFIMLVAFANADIKKFKAMIGSVKVAFGSQQAGQTAFPILAPKLSEYQKTGDKGKMNILDMKESEKITLFDEVRRLVESSGLSGETNLGMEKDGIRLSVTGKTLFQPGSAELAPETYGILNDIKDLLDKFDYTLIVEGHTDNVPIKSSIYPSNWELSAARAISVIRYFIEKQGVSTTKLMAVGYADSRPVANNDTPENRAKNRRVEFKFEQKILKKYHEKMAQKKSIELDVFNRNETRDAIIKEIEIQERADKKLQQKKFDIFE